MNTKTKLTEAAQLIQCEIGDLAFGIEKSEVLSIQRTERMTFENEPAFSELGKSTPSIERSEDVIGWLSDGARKIPVLRLTRFKTAGDTQSEVNLRDGKLSESARVLLLAPISSAGDDSRNVSTPPWGLLVDRVLGIVEVPRSRCHPAPLILMDNSKPSFHSIVRFDGTVLMLLDTWSTNPYLKASRVSAGSIRSNFDDKDRVMNAASAPAQGQVFGTLLGKPGSRGLVVFSLDSNYYTDRKVSIGLSISQVAEILESTSVIPIPAGPDYIGGLVFWRELPVPVVDVACRMGMPLSKVSDRLDGRRFIIARHLCRSAKPQGSNGGGNRPDNVSHDKLPILAAFEVHTDVRILKLPIASQPSTRVLPFNPDMVLSQVELDDETMVIPNLQELLSRGS